MKQGKLFWGTLFLSTGILAFLYEVGIKLHFGLDSDIIIPLLLVLLGLTFIIKQNSGKVIVIVLSGIVSSLLIYSFFWDDSGNDDSLFKVKIYEKDNDVNDTDIDLTDNSEEHISKIPYYKLEKVKLKLIAAASEMYLTGGESESYTAKVNGKMFDMNFNSSEDVGKLEIIHQKGETNSLKLKKLKVLVNTEPFYEIKLKSGASDLNLDLRDLKVKKLKAELAATDAEIKFGDEVKKLNADFEFAASQLTIYIPKDVGCSIHSELALVGKSFPGFVNIDDKTYETENYDNSKKKINISFKGAISGLDVKFY